MTGGELRGGAKCLGGPGLRRLPSEKGYLDANGRYCYPRGRRHRVPERVSKNSVISNPVNDQKTALHGVVIYLN